MNVVFATVMASLPESVTVTGTSWIAQVCVMAMLLWTNVVNVMVMVLRRMPVIVKETRWTALVSVAVLLLWMSVVTVVVMVSRMVSAIAMATCWIVRVIVEVAPRLMNAAYVREMAHHLNARMEQWCVMNHCAQPLLSRCFMSQRNPLRGFNLISTESAFCRVRVGWLRPQDLPFQRISPRCLGFRCRVRQLSQEVVSWLSWTCKAVQRTRVWLQWLSQTAWASR